MRLTWAAGVPPGVEPSKAIGQPCEAKRS